MLTILLLAALQAQPAPPPTTPDAPGHRHQITGELSGITLSERTLSVQAHGRRKGTTRAIQVKVPRECKILVNGKTGALADLQNGMRVRITADTAVGEDPITASRIVAHSKKEGEPKEPPDTPPDRPPVVQPEPGAGQPGAQPPVRSPAERPTGPRRVPPGG